MGVLGMAKNELLCRLTVMFLGMVVTIAISISVPITAKAHEANNNEVVEHQLLPSMKEAKSSSEQLDWFKNIRSWGKVEARNAIMQKLQELDSYNQGNTVPVDTGKLANYRTTSIDSLTTRTTLKIFVSSSMPKNLLKTYYAKAVKYGGTLVFKGLPGGSFRELTKLVLLIADNGETGSMQIDDEAFDRFVVNSVPSILLIKEKDYLSRCAGEQTCEVSDGIDTNDKVIYDKITGSIGVRAALEKFVANGDLSQEAKELLKND